MAEHDYIRMLNTPNSLSAGGSLEQITVLMSDLRGFTALCEQVEPNALVEILNHYFSHMGRVIKECHGTIIECMGDGILALFGAPVKKWDHAVQAAIAALKMQQAMTEINEWNRQRGYAELVMGIGINTGTAVVGNMGFDDAVKYNAVGRCINLCSRIENYAVDGQIFISEYTRRAIPFELKVRDQMEIRPKGVKDPVTIYSLQGMGAPYYIELQQE